MTVGLWHGYVESTNVSQVNGIEDFCDGSVNEYLNVGARVRRSVLEVGMRVT